ncbi:MAG: hypothetical protein ABI882_17215, partial [Acidobacteriota bacterium]
PSLISTTYSQLPVAADSLVLETHFLTSLVAEGDKGLREKRSRNDCCGPLDSAEGLWPSASGGGSRSHMQVLDRVSHSFGMAEDHRDVSAVGSADLALYD